MDDPAIDPEAHRRALRGLARLNRIAAIDRTVWSTLDPLLCRREASILDIAAGSGDLAVALARRAARGDRPYAFSACDISPIAMQAARDHARAEGLCIETSVLDALRDPLPEHHAVLMCHLFLHHLDEADIVALLARMKDAARHAVLVTDLARSAAGFALAATASRFATRSPVVHADALLSVRAALTPSELEQLANDAGLHRARIRTVWPERIILTWTR